MRIQTQHCLKTLTDGKVYGEALEDVLREMLDAEGVQDPGRDAEEEQQVTRILLLLSSLPHAQVDNGFKHCCGSGMFITDPDFYPSRISDPGSRIQEQSKRGGGRAGDKDPRSGNNLSRIQDSKKNRSLDPDPQHWFQV
jgi:hypothetical protein